MIKNKILLVEDNTDIILWTKNYLEEFGFEVTALDTVSDAISHINQNLYHIVLLDINLPDFSGYEILKHIEQNRFDLPVIVISAYADQKNKLHAFKLGASDYMTKPLHLEELEARIRVHTKTKHSDIEKNKTFAIDKQQILFNNTPLSLTKIEFEILSHLIKNKNTTIQRSVLCESLSTLSSHRSLDYHIRNIRKKLGDNAVNPKHLITDYGVGYKLIF